MKPAAGTKREGSVPARRGVEGDRRGGRGRTCPHGPCKALLLEHLPEENREDDGADGGTARGDPDDERAPAAKVGAEDREAGREEEAEREAHDDGLAHKDGAERLGERQAEDAGEPPDGAERELVPEAPAVEQDAGAERAREGDEQVCAADPADLARRVGGELVLRARREREVRSGPATRSSTTKGGDVPWRSGS